jgi:hypothetical protein
VPSSNQILLFSFVIIMIVISYYDGYVDAPVQADDCAGTTNSTNPLDVPFQGGNRGLINFKHSK